MLDGKPDVEPDPEKRHDDHSAQLPPTRVWLLGDQALPKYMYVALETALYSHRNQVAAALAAKTKAPPFLLLLGGPRGAQDLVRTRMC